MQGDRYGTTFRTYDRQTGAWHVNVINSASKETNAQLVARRSGEGIEMEGKLSDGTPIRWLYLKITPNAFHCRAEKLRSDGKAWILYRGLCGRRVGTITQAA